MGEVATDGERNEASAAIVARYVRHEAMCNIVTDLGAGAAARLQKRLLGMAWNKWASDARQMREEKAKLQRALARLMKRQLAAAWSRWAWVAAQCRGLYDRMKHAAGHMMNRLLSQAWRKWLVVSAEGKEDQVHLMYNVVHNTVVRVMHKSMAAA